MSFNSEERQRLAALADVLIPEADGMMSASQADVAGRWLDEVLKARPDLIEGLKGLLEDARDRLPEDFVAQLQSSRSPGMRVLAEVVPGAYFLNPDVRRMLGYQGQTPQVIDARVDYMEDGLLASVIRRGQVYRPTP
jgi:hypothetical protein